MSAFDEWADNLNESTPNKQNFSTGPVRVWMRMAFNAGLEAAAKEAERTFRVNIPRFKKERDAAFDIAVAIRALKEQT